MNVGEKIRQKRIELDMSQDELAKKVGYKSRSSIQKIEASRDLPLRKVKKMADALGTTPSYLMGWEEQVPRTASNAHTTAVEVQRPSYDPEVEKAMKLYEQFSRLTPEYQTVLLDMIEAAQIAADLRQTGKDKK